MSDYYPVFSKAVQAAAEALDEPEQIGSFAWQVKGKTGVVRHLHTDAVIDMVDRDIYLTFINCSCPHGRSTTDRSAACSHAFRVLQALYVRAGGGHDA